MVMMCAASLYSSAQFMEIDEHAKQCPKKAEKSIEHLAAYLVEAANSDIEKARGIFIWITENVAYDEKGLVTGRRLDCDAVAVLKNRKCVCEGYANLFLALSDEMGLEAEKITGFTKTVLDRPGKTLKESDHAWNRVKIDGRWKIFDATWGAGSSSQGEKWKQEFSEFWFDMTSYEAIFTHFPEEIEPRVIPLLSKSDFEQLPFVGEEYFTMGFDAKEVYRALMENDQLRCPKTYSIASRPKAIDVPRFETLVVGEEYEFRFQDSECKAISIRESNGKWTELTKENDIYSVTFRPSRKGRIDVCFQYGRDKNSFDVAMSYESKK